MFNRDLGKYNKAFVFGTGGGNDIVSAVPVAMYLQRHGIQTDIGGILSPAAVHMFDGTAEEVVNEIGKEVRRWIPSKKPAEISFIDGHLPGFAAEAGAGIPNFYDLSIRYGTSMLVENVRKLVDENGYDLIVGVDVGGDILARGAQDATILSPAMDFSSLYLLGELEADSLLVEFGLGTDGELRPSGIKEILEELGGKGIIRYESEIKKSDHEVKCFREIFERIKRIRKGHTAVMTLQTLDTSMPDEDIITEYVFRSRIGQKKWTTEYSIVLPHEYFGKAFVMDGKGLAAQRKQTAFCYENPIEQYARLKQVPSWKTELDLSFLWSGNNWTTPEQEGHCMMLLVPSESIPEATRREILHAGIEALNDDMCDMALVLKNDMPHISAGVDYYSDAGRFSVISQAEQTAGFLENVAREIKRYQEMPGI